MARWSDNYDSDSGYGDGGFPAYVPVAQRRLEAKREAQRLEKKGHKLDPVVIEGRTIADSFWGKAWCDHLEDHSDYANRLPRGRSYARNGAVIDLQITEGRIDARVRGSSLYKVEVEIERLAPKRWKELTARCSGRIESVVELLQGSVPEAVLSALGDRKAGLFPTPREIQFSCSCPDSASLCKHIAAVLYGVGARLDRKPELFFVLRRVALAELVTESAAKASPRPAKGRAGASAGVIEASALEGIFGIELDRQPARAKRSGASAARKPQVKPRGKKAAPAKVRGRPRKS